MKYNIVFAFAILIFVCAGCGFQSTDSNYYKRGNNVITKKQINKKPSVNRTSKTKVLNKKAAVKNINKKTSLKKELKRVAPNSSFKVAELKPNIRTYLNQSKFLRRNFEQNRKFIVSTEILDSLIKCPYGEVFRQAFLRVRNNSANQYDFDFYPRMATLPGSKELAIKEADNTVEFFNTCPIICIISPKSNSIIYYTEVGDAEGAELQSILDYLKISNW